MSGRPGSCNDRGVAPEQRVRGVYTGIGAGGQFITVLPKLDLLVAAYCGDNCGR